MEKYPQSEGANDIEDLLLCSEKFVQFLKTYRAIESARRF